MSNSEDVIDTGDTEETEELTNIEKSEQALESVESKKEPAVPMPSPKSPRFNEIYGKYKQAERNTNVLSSENRELAKNQERLYARIEELEAKYEKDKLDEKTQAIESDMDRAVANGDFKTYNDLKKSYKEVISPVPLSGDDVAKDIEVFKGYNPWFDKNPEMTKYAIKIEKDLIADPLWGKNSSMSYSRILAEVSRRTLETFESSSEGDIPPEDQLGKPTSKGKGEITLTEEQKSIARKILRNVSPEEAYKMYAKNLK